MPKPALWRILASLESHLAWQTVVGGGAEAGSVGGGLPQSAPPLRVDAIENYVRGLFAASPNRNTTSSRKRPAWTPDFRNPASNSGGCMRKRRNIARR